MSTKAFQHMPEDPSRERFLVLVKGMFYNIGEIVFSAKFVNVRGEGVRMPENGSYVQLRGGEANFKQ